MRKKDKILSKWCTSIHEACRIKKNCTAGSASI